MRFFWLSFRNLFFHGRANLAVMLGVLVGTAVLTGALLMGDSLRGSLRDLTLQRLGRIDFALVSERFFTADLGERLRQKTSMVDHHAPAILLRGTVIRRDVHGGIQQRVGQVQVIGVTESFWPLFQEQRQDLGIDYVVNQPLAQEMGLSKGDKIEIRLEKPQAVPAESFLHRRDKPEGILLERAAVLDILPAQGSGRFSLAAQQTQPLTVYVPLKKLQRRLALEQPHMASSINALFLAAKPGTDIQQVLAELNTALQGTVQLEDMGLTLRPDHSRQRYLSLESRRMIVEPEVVAAAQTASNGRPWQVVPTTTYLANLITHAERFPASISALMGQVMCQPPVTTLGVSLRLTGRYTPYSAITGLDPQAPSPLGPLLLVDGKTAPALGEGEILLSEFVVQDLWPAGDWHQDVGRPVVQLHYFREGDGYLLQEATTTLTFKGVVPLQGVARDRSLTPEIPGLKGNSIRDWDPPFPKSQWHPEWWREKDERFYQREKVTPKGFVSPATAHKLWQGKLGEYTSLRITPAPGTHGSLEQLDTQLRTALREALPLSKLGLEFQPVKELGLRSVNSSTAEMFGWLFVSFSFFLIASAAMLVGLLFRLGIERRTRELGLFFAVGYSLRQVRWLLLLEGTLIAFLGGLLGTLVALGYAKLLLLGMRSGWTGALEGSFLSFHFTAASLATGFGLSFLIAVGTIFWSLRSLAQLTPTRLLAGAGGWDTVSNSTSIGNINYFVVVVAFAAALVLLPFGLISSQQENAGLFFGSGALLLIGGLGVVRIWLRKQRQATFHGVGTKALTGLGLSNAGRTPGRSLLTVGLLASGTFLVVSVESFRKGPEESHDRRAGTGGFSLMAEADNPFPTVPNDPAEWRALLTTLFPEAEKLPVLPADVQLYGFRLRQGDDVSCLNLYQPLKPRILGVSEAMMQRGGFSLVAPAEMNTTERQNPWILLKKNLPPPEGGTERIVPIFADDHTAQWILQKQLGDVWTLNDERGQPFQVKLVCLIKGSIFQSELLMSEANFRRLFPSQGGYRYFLIEVSGTKRQETKQTLEAAFGEWFGFNITDPSERLAAFHAVENTYISTFQALGGLGVLLGTIGLGIVLLRNINERQRELALLRALGYSRQAIAWLVLTENALLIILGLGVGVVSAFLAIVPSLRTDISHVPWEGIVGLVLLVPVVGFLAGSFALGLALRTPLLLALRRE
jgi:ABC-type lipoprotein release transport system permease subunit